MWMCVELAGVDVRKVKVPMQNMCGNYLSGQYVRWRPLHLLIGLPMEALLLNRTLLYER